MGFKISKDDLTKLAKQTARVDAQVYFDSPECPGGRCGNNCAGTCAWSPCTNSYQATH